MAILWDGGEFNAAVSGEVIGPLGQQMRDVAISDISIDSRSLTKGAAFFCLKGPRFDGHDFILAAIKGGASFIVIDKARKEALSREIESSKHQIFYIMVDDVLASLYRLARRARERSKAKIIAITGSVGKTSSKELLYFLLAKKYKVHKNPASFNNHLGVPLSLARLPKEAEFAIFEIGMSHSGEIGPLSLLVKPYIAMISKIAPGHLANFPDLGAIAKAKAEIAQGLTTDAIILLNKDDPYYSLLADRLIVRSDIKKHSFGQDKEADYRLIAAKGGDFLSQITANLAGKEYNFAFNLSGLHNASNLMAILGCIDSLALDVQDFLPYLKEAQAVKGRGFVHNLRLTKGASKDDAKPKREAQAQLILIDESYNANPTSMSAAFANFAHYSEIYARSSSCQKPPPIVKRIILLGDMSELGANSLAYHLDLAKELKALKLDSLFLIGPYMKALYELLMGEKHNRQRAWQIIWRKQASMVIEPLKEYLDNITLSAAYPGAEPDMRAIMMVKSSHNIASFKITEYLLQNYPPVGSS